MQKNGACAQENVPPPFSKTTGQGDRLRGSNPSAHLRHCFGEHNLHQPIPERGSIDRTPSWRLKNNLSQIRRELALLFIQPSCVKNHRNIMWFSCDDMFLLLFFFGKNVHQLTTKPSINNPSPSGGWLVLKVIFLVFASGKWPPHGLVCNVWYWQVDQLVDRLVVGELVGRLVSGGNWLVGQLASPDVPKRGGVSF